MADINDLLDWFKKNDPTDSANWKRKLNTLKGKIDRADPTQAKNYKRKYDKLVSMFEGRNSKNVKATAKDAKAASAKRKIGDTINREQAKQDRKVSRSEATKRNQSQIERKKKEEALMREVEKEANAKSKSYKIKKGDTLSEIAKAKGTSVKELARKNNIKDPDKIYAGKTLKLNRGGYANCGASVAPNGKSRT